MKLSILDQAPIVQGKTSEDALQESLKLAQIGEEYGYERYWIAEHHDISSLACPAPEVMLSYIGAQTKDIIIGAGAVLLPHYKPYRIAETYNLLSTLFPNRIDLGIGRAPGGSAEATMALSSNFLENVRHFPSSVKQLLQFIYREFPEEEIFAKLNASPVPISPPKPWLLGTSLKSAKLAAEYGMAYVFGQFMSEINAKDVFETYRHNFKATSQVKNPEAIMAITSICAETSQEAEDLALWYAWSMLQRETGKKVEERTVTELKNHVFEKDEQKRLAEIKEKIVYGDKLQVKGQLQRLQQLYQIDELMIITITPTYQERIKSYEILGTIIKH